LWRTIRPRRRAYQGRYSGNVEVGAEASLSPD
jgi:hypothetical protein